MKPTRARNVVRALFLAISPVLIPAVLASAIGVAPMIAPARSAARAAEPATTPEQEKRVETLLAQLTVEEKLEMLHGDGNMGTTAVPRLNIPSLKFSDASVGVRCWGPSTAYPASVALAASWDPALAMAQGVALGRDSRARGVHILLGPGMNIARQPQGGRNFEYVGEDPLLASEIAVGLVKGVQSQGVAACIKHFVGNEQEIDRTTSSSEIDSRTLHEIYLPPFKAAIEVGGAWTLMNSYNKLNGVYCSQNDLLLNQILKKEWGFNGLAMSDWGSTHSAEGCANAGLDLDMPSGDALNAKALRPLLESGAVKQATIDDKVRRLLRVMVALGFLDRPQEDASIPKIDPSSEAVAYRVAAEGTVLLKNEAGLLPLDVTKVKRIVLIGPHAEKAVTGGGGSSWTGPSKPPVSMAAAIRAAVPADVSVEVIKWRLYGVPPVESSYEPIGDGANAVRGLTATYFDNRELSGSPVLTRIEPTLNQTWRDQLPVPEVKNPAFSVRWDGKIKPTETASYSFGVASDDGARVFLNGEKIIDAWWDHETLARNVVRDLEAGKTYDLRVEYYNSIGLANVKFGWAKAQPLVSADDLTRMKSADAVIACMGFDNEDAYEGEGNDRSWALKTDQAELLEAVSAARAKAIVVLNAGGSVDMSRWIDGVPGLLHAWYPGQNGNTAVADILFGKVNPSGKLPTTFEKKWEDAPAFGNYPGKDLKVNFAEGIYVGYRWFDTKKIEPLFPFGHGLSYTTFKVSPAEVRVDGLGSAARVTITANVTNTGARAGATVVQLYVRPAAAPVDRPFQELKAFSRLDLATGESKRVTLELDPTSLAYYDAASNTWKAPAGKYTLALGLSSRDIQQTVDLEWK